MMSKPRDRSKLSPDSYDSSHEFYFNFFGGEWIGPYQQDGRVDRNFKFEEMHDWVAESYPFGDHRLRHYKFKGFPGSIEGTQTLNQYGTSYKWVHSNTHVGPRGWKYADSGHLTLRMSDDPWAYVNKALSRSSPGRSDFSIINFIMELRDLHQLFEPGVGNQPINQIFGWGPMISDIMKMVHLADSIDKRLHELQRMQGRVRKERYSLGRETKTQTWRDVWWHTRFHNEKTTTRRAWAVVSHHIGDAQIRPPDKRFNRRQVREILSSDQPAIVIWNALPWSWFIDYFANINEMLQAFGGNRIPGYHADSLCVCIETVTDFRMRKGSIVDPRVTGEIRLRGGHYKRTDRIREIFPNPVPVLPRLTPLLSGSQVDTLFALGMAFATDRNAINSGLVRRG